MTIYQALGGNPDISKKYIIENSESWNEFCNFILKRFIVEVLLSKLLLENLMVLFNYNYSGKKFPEQKNGKFVLGNAPISNVVL